MRVPTLPTRHRRRRSRRVAAVAAVVGLAAAGPAATNSHTVRPGETLSGIAADHGVTVRGLAQANGITDLNLVRSGRRLSLPAAGAGSGGGGVEVSRLPSRLQSSPERLKLVPRFEHWAQTYGIPADLLMAMAWLESGWQNHVVSSAGAMGIGQLMPDTVTWMRDIVLRHPVDPANPDDNIRMSARYLRWLLDRTEGDPATALAGYYQGLAAVRAFGPSPATTVYVADVLAFRDRHF